MYTQNKLYEELSVITLEPHVYVTLKLHAINSLPKSRCVGTYSRKGALWFNSLKRLVRVRPINPRILGGRLRGLRLYSFINLLNMFFRFSCLGKSLDDNGPR